MPEHVALLAAIARPRAAMAVVQDPLVSAVAGRPGIARR
jgi:hypothetical protein